jgi:predicted MPP superfamily phosphohydrolase
LKALPLLAITVVQTAFCLAHWFMYATWIDFWWPLRPTTQSALAIAFALLSVIFIAATLLGFRFSNPFVKSFYWVAAIWIGFANFLLIAAILARLIDLVLLVLPTTERLAARPWIALVLLIAAIATGIYGFANARAIRERRISIRLPNLPPSWRGRTALLISDLHLGHINGTRFARRIAAMARRLDPAIIFIAGDLYDGTKIDPNIASSPLFELAPPFGIYFVDGNHEGFGGATSYEAALVRAGIRVLNNERVSVDGLQIVGVPYGPSTHPLALRAYLESLSLKTGPASILLNHTPTQLPVAEHAGVSLQLSGHTHGGGQFFPFGLITRRAFGRFTYGLQRFGDMQVYTSSGAGTWGPPMRVGTHPEIVLLTFD